MWDKYIELCQTFLIYTGSQMRRSLSRFKCCRHYNVTSTPFLGMSRPLYNLLYDYTIVGNSSLDCKSNYFQHKFRTPSTSQPWPCTTRVCYMCGICDEKLPLLCYAVRMLQALCYTQNLCYSLYVTLRIYVMAMLRIHVTLRIYILFRIYVTLRIYVIVMLRVYVTGFMLRLNHFCCNTWHYFPTLMFRLMLHTLC